MLPSQPTRIELKHEDSKELVAHRARHQEKQRAIQSQSSHNISGGLSSTQKPVNAIASRIGVPTSGSIFQPPVTSTRDISWR
jgi:hypothetical protein